MLQCHVAADAATKTHIKTNLNQLTNHQGQLADQLAS